MADYFVSSSGSNTSPYDTWAKAATNLTTALAAATADGDRVIIQYNAVPAVNQEISSTATFAPAASIQIISASNDGGSSFTPTPMGTGAWLGNSTTSFAVSFTGTSNKPYYMYGITMRQVGAGTTFSLVAVSGLQITAEDCYFWQGASSGASVITIGPTSGSSTSACTLINPTFRFGLAAAGMKVNACNFTMHGGTISTDGTTPTTFLLAATSTLTHMLFIGSDLSNCTNIVPNNGTVGHRRVELRQCKIPSAPYAAQSSLSNTTAQLEFFAWDCSSADTHYAFIYANGLGEVSAAAGGSEPYITADGATWETGGSKLTWKVVTNAGVRVGNPFRTPWIPLYNETVGSGLNPYFEALRKGSSTAYKVSEVWSEWTYKGTAGSTKATLDSSDRGGILASTTDQAASSLGAGDWTNEHASLNAYHKLGPTAAITPQEIGDICGRVCSTVANDTFYFDPKIRGVA